jgi:mannonate dehydratase
MYLCARKMPACVWAFSDTNSQFKLCNTFLNMMEKTWRWFGKKDLITLSMLKQIGVEGIVTSLHDVPNGTVWTVEKIQELKNYIEAAGLRWSVVESLPVSEAIKYAGPERDQLIENYKISLENLGKCGVKTVCYNFMPVLDWARTDLEYPLENGTTTLYFDWAEFAYFDCCVLKRPNARDSYRPEVLERMDKLAANATPELDKKLTDNIIIRTQGFVNGPMTGKEDDPIGVFRSLLDLYKGIDAVQLRENLKYFLEAIMPVCDAYEINMCIHPDDPPYPILGLPRIVTSQEDIDWIFSAVDNFHNGLTFCGGSLSAGIHNDVPAMAERFAHRVHFAHLRSCQILPNLNFVEAPHFGGRAYLIGLVRTFLKQNRPIPMRVDHAPQMLGDESIGYNAGYSFHGRMLALGQVEGIMATVSDELGL